MGREFQLYTENKSFLPMKNRERVKRTGDIDKALDARLTLTLTRKITSEFQTLYDLCAFQNDD